jgi:hypothetical protein
MSDEFSIERTKNGTVRLSITKVSDIKDRRLGIADETIAELIHAALSRYIGGLNGWRAGTYELCRVLAGVAHLGFPEGPAAERKHYGSLPTRPPRGIPPAGFSVAKTVMRSNHLRPLELNDLWAGALALDGEFATLPLDLVTQFVHPVLWPMFETSIRWGPGELVAWIRRYFLLAARGKLPPNFRPLSRGSIETQMTACWRWMLVLKGLQEGRYRQYLTTEAEQALQQWVSVPQRLDVRALGAKPANRDRTAPELEATREAYYRLEQRIAAKRTSKRGRRLMLRLLHDRCLLHVYAYSPRSEPLAGMRAAGDVDFHNNRLRFRELKDKREDTVEGIWKPAHPKLMADLREYMDYVGLTNSNGHTPLDQLDPDIYGACDPGSDYRPATRACALPLWISGRIYYDEKTGEPLPPSTRNRERIGRGVEARPNPRFPDPESLSRQIGVILAPYTGGVRKTGHTLRHLGQKLAEEGARDYLTAHDEPPYVTPQVIAAALLDHTMPGGIGAVYADLEPQRERLAGIAAYAITEYLTGDRGAKLGLDEERIIASRRRLEEAQAQLTFAQARVTELARELSAVRDHAHPRQSQIAALRQQKRTLRATALNDGHKLSEAAYRHLEQRLQQLDDELDDRRDELTALQGCLAAELAEESTVEREAAVRLHSAEEALLKASQARLALPPGQQPGDLDERLQELLGEVNPDGEREVEDQEPSLVRDWLTVKEYAFVMGIPHSTMRRYIRDALATDEGFPFDGGPANHRNPWFQPVAEILESYGPRVRRFNFDALNISRYTPGQIAAMKQFLRSIPVQGGAIPDAGH